MDPTPLSTPSIAVGALQVSHQFALYFGHTVCSEPMSAGAGGVLGLLAVSVMAGFVSNVA